jgi:hypothetical protein
MTRFKLLEDETKAVFIADRHVVAILEVHATACTIMLISGRSVTVNQSAEKANERLDR